MDPGLGYKQHRNGTRQCCGETAMTRGEEGGDPEQTMASAPFPLRRRCVYVQNFVRGAISGQSLCRDCTGSGATGVKNGHNGIIEALVEG